MSFIPGRAVKALLALTEVQASDDATICIDFDGAGKPVPILHKGTNEPLRLGELREIAAVFGAWL